MSETIHRGKFLEDKIKEKGYTKDEVAEGCGVKRNAIYQWIKLEDLDMRKLKKACDFMGIDLRQYFSNVDALYLNQQSKDSYEKKYYELLEKYTVVMEENATYHKKYGDLTGSNSGQSA